MRKAPVPLLAIILVTVAFTACGREPKTSDRLEPDGSTPGAAPALEIPVRNLVFR
ncbi:MAG: hypothetical protein ACM3WU_03785 [Bacillota bacterium]